MEQAASAQNNSAIPLYVDLDGTLVRSDTFLDTLCILLFRRPWLLFQVIYWLSRGRARLKEEVARRLVPDPADWPYVDALLQRLRMEKASGRRLILATASDRRPAEAVARHLGLFEDILASDGRENRRAEAKLAAIQTHARGPFGYAGNSRDDLVVWRQAAEIVCVNTPARILDRLQKEGLGWSFKVEDRRPAGSSLALALRPHQWAKNLLLLLPLLLSHKLLDAQALSAAFLAFCAFCATASAVYLFNDLSDLVADRRHPRKRERSLARGDLPPSRALAVAILLLAFALVLALCLPIPFRIALGIYLLATTAYSAWLKRLLLTDVVLLALLYLLRIVSGSLAIQVETTPWLLAFSLFFFLNLALVKRYAELLIREGEEKQVPGRGYRLEDRPLIAVFGASSGYLSVLVFALYIQFPSTAELYTHPQWLWLLAPVFIWWISRIWLLAGRGCMTDDPLVFALKDPGSWICLMLVGLMILPAL